MSRISFVVATALLLPAGIVPTLWAQETKTTSSTATNADEEQIRQAVVTFVEQCNAHKADAVAALFTPDARMTFRDGDEVNGREAIQKSFDELFQASPHGKISVVVDSIRFLTPEVAVEEGSTSNFPDGETLAARSHYTVLHVKKDGRWQMQATRVIENESLSAYGDLQPLEWLVGQWVDEGRSETVESDFKWDDNKSFLIEEFRVVRAGEVVLKGTQRIGWDPQAKQVRSWIFDSAGGFGEATWTQVGDEWISKFKAVRADGTSASATRTLTKVTPERAIWTMTDRVTDDEVLPNIAVTMVRKPPEPNAVAAANK